MNKRNRTLAAALVLALVTMPVVWVWLVVLDQ